MSFLNKITRHLNNATKTALQKENDTLQKKLSVFLHRMLETDAQGAMICDQMRQLNENVVYFVLNGTDIRTGERAFVAGLNWANLSPALIDRRFFDNNLAFTDRYPQNNSSDNTRLFSTKHEPKETLDSNKEYVNHCWSLVWEDYLNLTMEEEKNNLFTFNHWLLNKTNNPFNIGLYWGYEQEQEKVDNGYFFLPEETVRKLGSESLKNDDFHTLLLPERPEDKWPKMPYDRALMEVKTHFGWMEQQEEMYNTIGSIAFSVYHVIRSYGCWGGRAFYSIPVYYGAGSDKAVCVLSVCSKHPLDERMIERWTLVANTIFKDIVLHEVYLFKELQIKADFIVANYSLGHNLKNRVLDADTKIDEIRREIADVLDQAVDAEGNGVLRKHKILTDIGNVGLQVKSLANTGNLLDLVARAMTEKYTNVFALKRDWHTATALNLRRFIVAFYGEKFIVVSKLGNFAGLNIRELSHDSTVQPWLLHSTENTLLRPADFVYEEIFFELFVNALGYGQSCVVGDRNVVLITIRDEGGRISITNTPSKPLLENKKFSQLSDGEEYSVDKIGHGGLLYINNFLRITKTGSLCIRVDKTANLFSVILDFVSFHA
jgi:hypothetical protein